MAPHVFVGRANWGLGVRIAGHRDEYAGAFELVYRRYLARGYIRAHPGRIVYHDVFGCEASRTLIALSKEGQVSGTLTLITDNRLGFLSEATFGEEVQAHRRRGGSMAEICCLATAGTSEAADAGVFFALTRFMIQYAFWKGHDDLLLTIHPRHYHFYWRCFRVFPLGPCRPHGTVQNNPAVLCRIDLRNLRRNGHPRLWEQYFAEAIPATQFDVPPMDFQDHLLFCRRAALTSQASLIVPRAGFREAA